MRQFPKSWGLVPKGAARKWGLCRWGARGMSICGEDGGGEAGGTPRFGGFKMGGGEGGGGKNSGSGVPKCRRHCNGKVGWGGVCRAARIGTSWGGEG